MVQHIAVRSWTSQKPTAICLLIILVLWAGIGDAATRYVDRHTRDVFDSSASNEQMSHVLNPTNIDESITTSDGLLPEENEDVDEVSGTSKHVIEHQNNVENIGNTTAKNSLVDSSSDANNAIEQMFESQRIRDDSVSSRRNRTRMTMFGHAGSMAAKDTIPADTSQDNRENRLPIKHGKNVPIKKSFADELTSETQSSLLHSTEQSIFATSSERDSELPTTSPVSTTNRQTPPPPDTIRTRISSDVVTTKRAKYLNTETSSAVPSERAEPSWPDLKAIGEVNHNNVSNSKPNIVDGKLDMDGDGDGDKISTADESAAVGMATTDRSTADEHQTQSHQQQFDLDANSSRIDDHVQQDNSLNGVRSTSTVRPVLSIKKQSTIRHGAHIATITDNPRVPISRVGTSTTLKVPTMPTVATSTTQRTALNAHQPSVPIEEEIPSTTKEEIFSTVTSESVETSTIDQTMSTPTREIAVGVTEIATETPGITENTAPTTVTTDAPMDAVTTAGKREEHVEHESGSTDAIDRNQTTLKTTTIPDTIVRNVVNLPKSQPSIHKQSESIAAEPDQITPAANKANSKGIDALSSMPTEGASSTTTEQSSPSTSSITPTTTTTSTTTTTTASTTTSTSTSTSTTTATMLQGINTTTMRTMTMNRDNAPTNNDDQTETAYPSEATDVNAMIAAAISIVAVITLFLLVGFLVVMRKRQKQLTYGQRCRPIGLDAYSLDNVSVYNSLRRKSALRASKMAFGNVGFDDPALKNNPLNIVQLITFAQKRVSINEEFKDVPVVTARIEEVPLGCEDRNRYANVVPLPESRVLLKRLNDDDKTEYINANYVKGPKDTTHYYIACQAPLEHTVVDFWRMIWEQNSRVIIMATDLTENGIEKCAEYLPSSFVVDNHVIFGDFQITLKNREVRDKYAVSTVHLKNACTKTWREITHFWYQWPESGSVPSDEASVIAMLLEARSYLKAITTEQTIVDANLNEQESNLDLKANGASDKTKSLQRVQGPLTVHCSPGTGRTGTIIACDIAIRSLEQPTRTVDVPLIVYFVRRGRASAVQTRDQYEYIYKVAHVYATKLTGPINDN